MFVINLSPPGLQRRVLQLLLGPDLLRRLGTTIPRQTEIRVRVLRPSYSWSTWPEVNVSVRLDGGKMQKVVLCLE